MVIPQLIIISIGIINIYESLKKGLVKTVFGSGLIILFIYSLLKLYSSVIILNEYHRAKYWDWGWQKVAEVLMLQDKSLPVVIDNARSDPDLQLAFFLKYDPLKYQTENFEVPMSEYYTNLYRNKTKHVGQIVTRPISWKEDLIIDQYLVGDELGISNEQILEHNLTLLTEIKYPDRNVAYRIVKTNPVWEKQNRLNYLVPANK